MVAPMQIGGGIEIGGGITIGTSPSFTITSEDLSSPFLYYNSYSSYDTNGFTSANTPNPYIYNGVGYYISTALENAITAAYSVAGLSFSSSYAWNVAWTTGGSGIARIGFNGPNPNTIVIAPIDTTDTRWQSGNTNSALKIGTFAFPATFSLYSPATPISGNNNWC